MPRLNPKPVEFHLNIDKGYDVHPYNGDSIIQIANAFGKKIPTGQAYNITPKILDPIEFDQIKKVKVGKVDSTKASPNKFNLPITLSPKKSKRGGLFHRLSKKENFRLKNEIGDTLKTGVNQIIKSKTRLNVKPTRKKAKAPRFKDSYAYNLQYLDVDQGMNSSYVFDVLEGMNGNIWMATWGGGLSMYDGENFHHFTKDQGLTNNYIRTLFQDSEGNFWLGMEEGGLCLLEIGSDLKGNTIHQFTEAEGLSGKVVYAISEDDQGNIWIGFEEKGLCVLTRKKESEWSIIRLTSNEGLTNNFVTSLFMDLNHNMWIGTAGGGISIVKESDIQSRSFKFYSINEESGLLSDYVTCMKQDREGNVWVGSEDEGICKISTKYGVSYGSQLVQFTNYSKDEGLSDNEIISLYVDVDDVLWVGTYSGGLNRLTENKNGLEVLHLLESHGLPHNSIFNITQDSDKNIWFGTDGGGLVKFKTESFEHFTEYEGLPYPVVLSIFEDKESNIWFGTDGGGLALFDEDFFFLLNENNGLINDNVWSMVQDSNGDVWIGTNGAGACKLVKGSDKNWTRSFDASHFEYYNKEIGLPTDYVVTLLEDSENNIWMGTWGDGLLKLSKQEDGGYKVVQYSEENALTKSVVLTVFEDCEHNIWLGSEGGGLSKISKNQNGEERITHFSMKEGLGSNSILSIHQTPDTVLWLGTEGAGLVKFDEKNQKVTIISEREGLADDLVWSIEEDKEHNFWLSTEKGISKIEFIEDDFKISNFRKQDGLKGVDFYNNSSLYDSKNNLWVGSGKGLTKINTLKYNRAEKPPSIKINKIDVNEAELNINSVKDIKGIDYKGFDEFYNYPIEISLPYDQNHLAFYFSGLEWNAPHKIKYSYMIDELNSNWSIPKSENKAEYRNLPYGSYTFRVRAIGELEEWSEEQVYHFIIRAPWWFTWWAWLFYAVFSIGAFIIYVRWRTIALKRKQKELEREISNATAEISEQHHMLEESYKEITDSIAYAKRIQNAILPSKDQVKKLLPDSFILYKPKDVVAGDFYWLEETEDELLFAVADCTGHGVPGAMVSVVCNNALNRSIREHRLTDPGLILDKSKEIILEEFGKSKDEVNDGMDISLVSLAKNGFHSSELSLSFSGAHNSIWILREGYSPEFMSSEFVKIMNYEEEQISLIEMKANKQPVGRFDYSQPFRTSRFDLLSGDLIYLFSDGIIDQFGGPKGKKFKTKALRKLLFEIRNLDLNEQKKRIDIAFEEWKGNLEQIDDVCIMAVRV